MDASPQRDTEPESLVLVCKPGYEETLAEEVRERMGGTPRVETGRAMIVVRRRSTESDGRGPVRPFVFERQRLEQAAFLCAPGLKPIAREIIGRLLPAVDSSDEPWTLHAFVADPEAGAPPASRAANLSALLLDTCRTKYTRLFRRYRPPEEPLAGGRGLILNLCLAADGAWGSVMPAARLSDPMPGGAHRMPFDPRSPSRSYLKIEEALDLMGETPVRGQRVIDLGAAPGGWSYAFLKRGCRVTAVDNGPLRIRDPEAGGGQLAHVREDGIGFRPPPEEIPVDWLVSDMLVPPGTNIGMLRPWFAGRWMRRFVVNIKLPQQQPWAAITPLAAFLAAVPGCRHRLRQLYHDRREITLLGWLDAAGREADYDNRPRGVAARGQEDAHEPI